VHLSHARRLRHTRLTRPAELGLPVHVLQRYAGHASPGMSMYYVAQRDEHAEQALIATRKFKADGTLTTFTREDYDGMHLFNRADRFLPNGSPPAAAPAVRQGQRLLDLRRLRHRRQSHPLPCSSNWPRPPRSSTARPRRSKRVTAGPYRPTTSGSPSEPPSATP
jgi:hypothetical protein